MPLSHPVLISILIIPFSPQSTFLKKICWSCKREHCLTLAIIFKNHLETVKSSSSVLLLSIPTCCRQFSELHMLVEIPQCSSQWPQKQAGSNKRALSPSQFCTSSIQKHLLLEGRWGKIPSKPGQEWLLHAVGHPESTQGQTSTESPSVCPLLSSRPHHPSHSHAPWEKGQQETDSSCSAASSS